MTELKIVWDSPSPHASMPSDLDLGPAAAATGRLEHYPTFLSLKGCQLQGLVGGNGLADQESSGSSLSWRISCKALSISRELRSSARVNTQDARPPMHSNTTPVTPSQPCQPGFRSPNIHINIRIPAVAKRLRNLRTLLARSLAASETKAA